MERTTALKKLRALLGPEFGWRINPRAADREEREQAKLALPALIDARKEAEEALEARRAALLADAEYQRLKERHRASRKEVDETSGLLHSYRFTVGKTVSGLFFSVQAEGDSWEEVIEKLRK